MPPIRTVLVSPVPGNPVASGTDLRNALAGISSPSATNRWLLKIEPGIYDVGTVSLQMRPWIDIEGSGIGVTAIRGRVDPRPNRDRGTVNGANDAEIRLLTIKGGATAKVEDAIAMFNLNASPRLYRVRLLADGQAFVSGMRNVQSAPLLEECEIIAATTRVTSSEAYGIVFNGAHAGQKSSILRSKIMVTGAARTHGVHLVIAQTVTEIRDTRIEVSGGEQTSGIYAQGTGWASLETLSLRNVEISSTGGSTASYGVHFEPDAQINMDIFNSSLVSQDSPTTCGIAKHGLGTITLQGSKVAGLTKTVDSPVGNVSIASTYLQGGPVTTVSGTRHCMGVWDENGVFYPSSCPP